MANIDSNSDAPSTDAMDAIDDMGGDSGNSKTENEDYSDSFLGNMPRIEEANQIVKINALLAAGTGLIPMALLGTLTITGVQIKMIAELSKLYKVDFSENAVKTILASICGGIISQSLGQQLGSALVMSIPVLGPTFNFLGVSVVASGMTYAIGQTFLKHFESGGTLLNFTPDSFRQSFVEQYERGARVVKKGVRTAA